MVRAFIALELPAEVRSELARVQQTLQTLSRGQTHFGDRALKWVNPDGIHLTLKFLGEVPESLVLPISQAVSQSAAGRSALALRLDSIGVFPNERRPRVLWVGLAGDLRQLSDLQTAVDRALSGLGFAPENRAFSPHLTLARVREEVGSVERQAIGELLLRSAPANELPFVASRLSLMKSELRREGARYEPLQTVTLGE